MSRHSGLDILECLASADDRVISILGYRHDYYENCSVMEHTRGEPGGGIPYCESFANHHHWHRLWHAPFWGLVRKGWVAEWACYRRGDVLYRITDAGRAALAKHGR